MTDTKNISAAFLKAQKGFAPAIKNSINPAFRSKYADLGACIEAVMDSLNANGIALVQKTHPSDDGVTVETVFLHESGESMSGGQLHVPASKKDPQGYGSALSYARRYSLMTACGIAPEDDDGNAGVDAKRRLDAQPPAAQPDMSPKAIATRLTAGVKAGDAEGACDYLITLDDKPRDAIWALLDTATQNKLTAVWPKEPA